MVHPRTPAHRAGAHRLQTELSALLGDRYSDGKAIRERHARDESPFPAAAPDAVVFRSTEEVAAIARACHAHRA